MQHPRQSQQHEQHMLRKQFGECALQFFKPRWRQLGPDQSPHSHFEENALVFRIQKKTFGEYFFIILSDFP